ncbi:chromosomal replication initiator protein DnaA [Aquabacterium fontiphilum]|jgi:chromosomal replication initiator protein|uniref:chromosomal replication initiator protein DnaA n=1 Tax=Aquabacterium fontiphilum TaxID=450365 RepID=UPI001378B49B|nr:chromosomal replication initiator protein DnaA [Aquabacterium fontiphilum]NBD19116.1 chromosomal replication initiator protein DnaA [Aquabacterium fontiphilum]
MSAAELPATGLTDLAQLWARCCERLATELPEQQFNTWIRPLPEAEASRQDGATVLAVRVPNRFMLDWIRTQYSARLESILAGLIDGPVRLDITLAPRMAPAPMGGMARPGSAMPARALPPNAQVARAEPAASQPAMAPEPARRPSHQAMGLNPALTFDNLVPGRANQMARTAALHVAGSPGHMYNPLFIYGGVGLGKTHLMNAVGNALLADNPDARILYLHAEQFISDVVKNYQRKTFDELKAKYHQLDLLLIDDVQFFAGKDRTQEEFFNAFEALLAKKAHIIMTSDTYPKGLANIDERLTSRFDSGLTVAIEPPELEMRVAILIKKAAQEGIEMPEDVAFFVAKNVRANVRELEGALRKVLAFAKFSHKEITIHLAREALKDLLSIQNRQISVENIQKTVADFYKIKVADMYSKKRPASIARPRQIAMYLAKELTQKSLPEIGELFGGRDHTTVLHACRKIAGDRAKDTELNQQLHVLEQTLKG